VAPALSVSEPAYVNQATVSAVQIIATSEVGDPGTYTLTDGTTTLSGSKAIPSSGKWNINPNVASLKDGTLTLTVTVTDAAGNASVSTTTFVKDTVPPPAPTVTLNPLDDSGLSSTDYVTSVTRPRFTVTDSQNVASFTVYVNGVVYTGQTLAPGSYTVTATATDAAGNTSTAGTAPKTLVVDTTAPTGSFSISGAKTINGQLAVGSQSLTLQLSFSDANGPAQMAFSTDGGATFSSAVAYATTGAVTLPAANGLYAIVVRVTDLAGNSTNVSQTVRLDTIGPAVSYSLAPPPSSGSYDLGTNPVLTYSATDVDGISSISATADSGSTVTSGGTINLYTLSAGAHTVVISATDGVGNTSSVTVTITVHASIAGLKNAVNYGNSSGQISNSTVSSLLSTLNSAQTALSAGQNASAKSYLNSFSSQVSSAGSNKIASSFAALLINWTSDLVARL
jgi:hypothetical protein